MFQNRMMLLQFFVVVLACWVGPSESFGVTQRAAGVTGCSSSSTSTTLHMFGGLKDAFKNDDALGTRPNEGLKGGPNYNEQVTVNGVAVKGAVVGQKLTVVASKVRVKIPVNCQKGDCGTCVVSLNGRKVKGTRSAIRATRPGGKVNGSLLLF
jgi:ferredoxin